MTPTARITVAICTWNRAALLRQTLTRLSEVWRPETSATLLVVDNGSTDNSRAVAESFSSRLPLRVVQEATPGLSNARNRAVAEATTSHVLFTDDDVLVEDGWLPAFIEAAARYPDAAVFGGPIEPWFPETPDPDMVAAFPALGSGFCGLDHHRPQGLLPAPLEVFGANMGFRRAALGDLRFDSRLGHVHGRLGSSEETTLIDSLRKRSADVVWVPGMRLRHYVAPERMTVPYLLQFYREVARGEARRKGPPEGPRILGVPQWILRQAVQSKVRAHWHGARRNRQASLLAHRQYQYYSGMAVECFLLHREKSAATDA
jgi:glycosyltransferase involved in cell wall biosynthesis